MLRSGPHTALTNTPAAFPRGATVLPGMGLRTGRLLSGRRACREHLSIIRGQEDKTWRKWPVVNSPLCSSLLHGRVTCLTPPPTGARHRPRAGAVGRSRSLPKTRVRGPQSQGPPSRAEAKPSSRPGGDEPQLRLRLHMVTSSGHWPIKYRGVWGGDLGRMHPDPGGVSRTSFGQVDSMEEGPGRTQQHGPFGQLNGSLEPQPHL